VFLPIDCAKQDYRGIAAPDLARNKHFGRKFR
jgi:hypothetical protein